MRDNNDYNSKLHLLFDLWDSGDLRFKDADSFVDHIVQHISDNAMELTLEIAEYREDHVGNNYQVIIDEIFYRQASEPEDDDPINLGDVQKIQQIENMFKKSDKKSVSQSQDFVPPFVLP